MKSSSAIHWPLILLKVAVVLGAVLLDVAGRLSPQGSAAIISLVTVLGGVQVANVLALLRHPPVAPALIEHAADLVADVLAAARGDAVVTERQTASLTTERIAPSQPHEERPLPFSLGGKPLALALAFLGLPLAACATTGGRATFADADSYISEQNACITAGTTRAAIDSCRAESRARWCSRFPSSTLCVDGGSP